jgi:hypothetical protein
MTDFSKLPRFRKHAHRVIELVPQWAMAYQVDELAIWRQLPIAHVWCEANPDKAPKKNVIRFLNSWMRQARSFGNLVVVQTSRPYVEPLIAPEDLLTYEDILDSKERKTP